MVQKELLEGIISEYLEKNALFLVDITISRENDIEITIDSFEGVHIDNCSDISRIIEEKVSRDDGDYSLTVGSAGLSQPFKVIDQYRKFKGSEIEIVLKSGLKFKAFIVEVNDTGIKIEYEKSERPEGSKKKIKFKTVEFLEFTAIKSAKPIINFR
jgi:ribosome maturation factor RimP